MTIQSQHELEITKQKLRELEEHYRSQCGAPTTDPRLRELSLRSVKKWINRLTEEIVRYEAHARTKG
ncbi:MAG: hypothetical protein K2R98_07830 [Gemmataceae bacterium]|nr:hypothetical protein [Gemmataceae bacterium]